ncbi:hypothetical protein D3C87_1552580 [compost metagenome]
MDRPVATCGISFRMSAILVMPLASIVSAVSAMVGVGAFRPLRCRREPVTTTSSTCEASSVPAAEAFWAWAAIGAARAPRLTPAIRALFLHCRIVAGCSFITLINPSLPRELF